MGLESGTYISDLVVTNPVGSTDPVSDLDGHDRLIKSTIKNTFPNITGAVTPTQAELNRCDITTEGTAEASKVMTTDASNNSTGANQITATAFVGLLTGNVTGNVTGNCTGTAGSITGQGALALLDTISTTELDPGAVTFSKIGDNAIRSSKIDWTLGTFSQSFATGVTNMPEGLYILAGTATAVAVDVEVYNGVTANWGSLGGWSSIAENPIFVISGGAANQVRINNTSGASRTVYGFKLA